MQLSMVDKLAVHSLPRECRNVAEAVLTLEAAANALAADGGDVHRGLASFLRLLVHYLRYESNSSRLLTDKGEGRIEALYGLCYAGLSRWRWGMGEFGKCVDLQALVSQVIATAELIASAPGEPADVKLVAEYVRRMLSEEIANSPGNSKLHSSTVSESSKRPQRDEVIADASNARVSTIRHAIRTALCVATEWNSRHGGLSTLNRDFCIAMSRRGHKVFCYTGIATSEEVNAACREGVEVIIAPAIWGLAEGERLFRRPMLPTGVVPDLIIGHDRHTGPMAAAIKHDHFPACQLALFIHTAPGEIEPYKERDGRSSASETAETKQRVQDELAQAADVVVAIGPRLSREIGSVLHARSPKKVIYELNPGLRMIDNPGTAPPALMCLLLGRAEDYSLKGLDVAARAFGILYDKHVSDLEGSPTLVVRGAPKGSGDALRKQILREAKTGGVNVRVLEYTENMDCLTQDIMRSSLVLMPSKREGFGLVALEAISAAIPVLISNQSGLAELLQLKVPELARQCVVPVIDQVENDAAVWARNIWMVLKDRNAAIKRAFALRERLNTLLSWEASIDAFCGALLDARM